MVGEAGPEIIVPKQDATVLNHNDTVQALGGNGINGAPLPTKQSPDYNTQGYVDKYGQPDQSKGQHLTDEFKLPNHPTFSTDSQYSNDKVQGGVWQQAGSDKWVFTPSDFNLKMNSPESLAEYFRTSERKGTFVNLPNGQQVEGTK
jgi:hypothetical protein